MSDILTHVQPENAVPVKPKHGSESSISIGRNESGSHSEPPTPPSLDGSDPKSEQGQGSSSSHPSPILHPASPASPTEVPEEHSQRSPSDSISGVTGTSSERRSPPSSQQSPSPPPKPPGLILTQESQDNIATQQAEAERQRKELEAQAAAQAEAERKASEEKQKREEEHKKLEEETKRKQEEQKKHDEAAAKAEADRKALEQKHDEEERKKQQAAAQAATQQPLEKESKQPKEQQPPEITCVSGVGGLVGVGYPPQSKQQIKERAAALAPATPPPAVQPKSRRSAFVRFFLGFPEAWRTGGWLKRTSLVISVLLMLAGAAALATPGLEGFGLLFFIAANASIGVGGVGTLTLMATNMPPTEEPVAANVPQQESPPTARAAFKNISQIQAAQEAKQKAAIAEQIKQQEAAKKLAEEKEKKDYVTNIKPFMQFLPTIKELKQVCRDASIAANQLNTVAQQIQECAGRALLDAITPLATQYNILVNSPPIIEILRRFQAGYRNPNPNQASIPSFNYKEIVRGSVLSNVERNNGQLNLPDLQTTLYEHFNLGYLFKHGSIIADEQRARAQSSAPMA